MIRIGFGLGVAGMLTACTPEFDAANARMTLIEDLETKAYTPALSAAMADCVLETLTPEQIRSVGRASSNEQYVQAMRASQVPRPIAFVPCGEAALAAN